MYNASIEHTIKHIDVYKRQELSHISEEFAVICEELNKLGVEIGVNIKLQHEDIFNKMHRI